MWPPVGPCVTVPYIPVGLWVPLHPYRALCSPSLTPIGLCVSPHAHRALCMPPYSALSHPSAPLTAVTGGLTQTPQIPPSPTAMGLHRPSRPQQLRMNAGICLYSPPLPNARFSGPLAVFLINQPAPFCPQVPAGVADSPAAAPGPPNFLIPHRFCFVPVRKVAGSPLPSSCPPLSVG